MQALALIVLAQSLGAHDFGVFSLVLVVQSLVAVVSNLGILTSSQYHVGRGELNVEQVAALSLAATAAGCVLLVPPSGFMLSWLYPGVFPDLPLGLFVLGVLAGPIRLGYEALLGVFIGIGDVRGQSLTAVTGPASFLAILSAGALTVGLSLPVAVVAWFVSQATVLVVALIRFRRHGRLLPPGQVTGDRRVWAALLRVGVGAYASYVAYWITMRIDRVALSAAGGADAVGIFSLAAWIAESFALLPMVIGSILFPRMAADARSSIAGYLPIATRTVLAVSGALAAVTVLAFAGLALALGETILLALPLLVLILPGHILFALFGVFINYWITQGRAALPAAYYAIAGIAKAAIVLILFDAVGLIGVAAAMSLVGAATALVAARAVARDLGVSTSALLVPGIADLRRAAEAALRVLAPLKAPPVGQDR